MHRAIQEILLGETVYCLIKPVKIEKHYAKILSIEQKCNIVDLPQSLWQRNAPSEKANLLLVKEFTQKEVKCKLLMKIYDPLCLSRSRGLDRISYEHLRRADRDFSKMTFLFNACLELQTVPKIWMEMFSVLVIARNNNDSDDNHSEDYAVAIDKEDIKNWNPITMQRTASKLFQSLIAARLITWAKKTKRLSANQRGFLMHDAAGESSFILQECKNYAEYKKKDLAVARLDFTNASDTIPQSAVLHALTKHSVPSPIIKIIQNILDSSYTKFRVMGNSIFTKLIKILKGLPQGSPLNPILLDLVIEPVLRSLLSVENHDNFELFNKKINHYAIPNELTLMADSPQKLQTLLKLVEENGRLVGLKFNINKCSTYHYKGKTKELKSDRSFLFFGQKLSALQEEDVEEYFGVKQGISIGQDSCPNIQELLYNIERIDGSPLDQYQKVDAILIYVIPRVENYLRSLQNIDEKSLEAADLVLRETFKKLLELSTEASTESIVYQVAGIKQNIKEDTSRSIQSNYLPFMDLFHIMKIVHGLKMLTSENEVAQTVAFETLTADVDSLKASKNVKLTRKNLAQYLSGELHIKNMKSKFRWHAIREATLKLKVKIPIKWQYNNGMQVTIEHKGIERTNRSSGKNSSSVEKKLKNALVEYYIDMVMKKSSGPDDNLKV